MKCLSFLVTLLSMVSIQVVAGTSSDPVDRLPLHRVTELTTAGKPAVVILAPDEQAYMQLGQQLALAIQERTGVTVPVESAAGYVDAKPKVIRRELLDRHFILLGQFWNNAVLERLYANYFDATDAYFPGPGGWELRTVCSPFKHGQNCVVATGSDLAGCKKAVEALPGNIADGRIPYLLDVHMTGEAAKMEAEFRKLWAPYEAELDRYTVFGHPQAVAWSHSDPTNLWIWHDVNLAIGSCFGWRYWVTGDSHYADIFKQMVGARMAKFEEYRSTGKEGLMDYCGPEAMVAWV